jgi:hypothetical protein
MKWSDAEIALLRDTYPHHTAQHVADFLGRGIKSVYCMAHILGMSKSAEFYESQLSTRIKRGQQHPSMVANQFKPGIVPWNKGINFDPGGRCAETRFKKGQMSGAVQHNYVPIGTLRITKDGYLERKMTDDQELMPSRRWTPVHRLVWQDAHGPIPAGHIVVFRPGMKTIVESEITIDRLECITRAENLRRNGVWRDPELGKLYQLKGAIARQVNRIKKESA